MQQCSILRGKQGGLFPSISTLDNGGEERDRYASIECIWSFCLFFPLSLPSSSSSSLSHLSADTSNAHNAISLAASAHPKARPLHT